jgi:hypothetical protein
MELKIKTSINGEEYEGKLTPITTTKQKTSKILTMWEEHELLTHPGEGRPYPDRTIKFINYVCRLSYNPVRKSRAWREAAEYCGERWGTCNWGFDASIRWAIAKGFVTMDEHNIVKPFIYLGR